MPAIGWVLAALGVAATFPEAMRIHGKYGLLLSGVMWLLMGATIWFYVWAVLTGFEPMGRTYFNATHVLLVCIAPLLFALAMMWKYNVATGIFLGAILMPFTLSIHIMLHFNWLARLLS